MNFLFRLPLLLLVLLIGGYAPNVYSASVSDRFDAAKQSRPQLIMFLKKMPKGGDLHNHLLGATYSEYTLKSAEKGGLHYNLKTHLFTSDALSNDVVSLDQLKRTTAYFEDFRQHYSMRGWTAAMGTGRDHFFDIFQRLGSSGRQRKEMLAEVIRHNQLQNIEYLELIAAVVPPQVEQKFHRKLKKFDINNLDAAYAQIKDMTISKAVDRSISRQLDGWENYAFKAVRSERRTKFSPIRKVTVRYIPYVVRLGPLRDFFGSVAAAFTAVNADRRIVALNIVAPEDAPDANDYFEDQMKIIDFLWKKMGHPLVTLHAGELTMHDATLQSMSNRIRLSIDEGHARRIGHGVSIAWENDAAGLLKQMAASKILVEINLTSNEVILGVSGHNHPFELYRAAGVPLSLNTDDEGITRSPLTMEFVKAVERYNLSYSDVVTLIRNSIEYSFLAGKSLFIAGNYDKIRAGFEGLKKANWHPDAKARRMISQNRKLALQMRLERDIASFERIETDK